MNEFEIIKKYFTNQQTPHVNVVVGIGDDCALLTPPHGQSLAVTTDTLVSDVHFFANDPAANIGHKALAVNLSDLAAMGATPAWVTLALTLPKADEAWLKDFCAGFFNLANEHNVQLIGGDITHGPLSINITALGFVPVNKALLRSNAQPGDLIYVSGTLGDAGLALHQKQLHYPQPRIALGQYLSGVAHAAIDISDGLAADLTHILKASSVGAKINIDLLPLSATLKQLPREEAINLALSAGDDYELCFTIPSEQKAHIEQQRLAPPLTCIGEITTTQTLELLDQHGKKYNGKIDGYQHF